jgi:6-pyruvoyl tetrahydropterin synthase/QueD family protein
MELMKEFTFEASHILPKHPGKCSRLHGHSWKLKVYVKGEIDPKTNFVADYGDIKKSVNPIIEQLDHHHLGQWLNEDQKDMPTDNLSWGKHGVIDLGLRFYPSSENLIVWIARQLWYLDLYAVKRETLWSIERLNPGQIIPVDNPQTAVERKVWWSRLELNETCTSACILTREEYDARYSNPTRS